MRTLLSLYNLVRFQFYFILTISPEECQMKSLRRKIFYFTQSSNSVPPNVYKLVYDYINNKPPLSLSYYLKKSCDVSNRSTRTSVNPYKLYKPLYRTNIMQRNIKYQGIKIWNSISQTIQELPKTSFKIKLKLLFLQSYN